MDSSLPVVLELRKRRGSKLIVVDLPVLGAAVESQNLATALEYVQADSVRKMITKDWADQFIEDKDYVIVRAPTLIKEFERDYADILGLKDGRSMPARASRGRLFLLESGVTKLLERCSRSGVDAVRLALGKVFSSFRAPDIQLEAEFGKRVEAAAEIRATPRPDLRAALEELQEIVADEAPEHVADDFHLFQHWVYQRDLAMCSLLRQAVASTELEASSQVGSSADSAPATTVQINEVSSSTTQLEDRKFRYNAIQTLIHQLTALERPEFLQLALEAAEVALDRSMPSIREMLAVPGDRAPGPRAAARAPDPIVITAPGATGTRSAVSGELASSKGSRGSSSTKASLEGPRFKGVGYYSLTQIGEKAGGYSAKTAGLAADVVAARMGLSGDAIRHVSLNFNTMIKVPDTTTGKKRDVAHFDVNFSNAVIDELRRNDEFQPQVPSPPSSFSSGAFPKLTRGVFDDEEPKH